MTDGEGKHEITREGAMQLGLIVQGALRLACKQTGLEFEQLVGACVGIEVGKMVDAGMSDTEITEAMSAHVLKLLAQVRGLQEAGS
jgi:hypothetical protein